ncbi:MAG: peptidyl-prolyl cis-trans isomerase [Planctomycetota bacterium]
MRNKSIALLMVVFMALQTGMSAEQAEAQGYRMLQPIESTPARTETPDDYFQPQREPRGYQGNRSQPRIHNPSSDSQQLASGGMFDPQVRPASHQSADSGHQPVMWDSQTSSGQTRENFGAQVPWGHNDGNPGADCASCGGSNCTDPGCAARSTNGPQNSIIRSTTYPRTPAPDLSTPGAQPLAPVAATPGVQTASWESDLQEQRDDNVQQVGGFEPSTPGPTSFTENEASGPVTPAEPAPVTAEAFEPGRVIARVGGQPIFIGDMMFEINQLIEKGMPGAPERIRRQLRPQFVKRLLPKYIDEKVLYVSVLDSLPPEADIEAIISQAEIEFTDSAMPGMMEQMEVRTPAEFDGQLRVMGSSLRRLKRSWAIEQFTRYFLLQELQIDTEVTHQDMLDFYHEHIDEYEFKARSRWEQVMVQFSQFDSRSAAREALVEMGNRIVYGADLAAVAKESSHGFMAADGGQHDWTSRGSLVHSEIDEAIFTLPVGELSDIIETRDGYHIVRVIEREDAGRTPFLEAQVEIRQQIESVKREEAFQIHIEKLKEAIPVEIYEDELEKLVEGENFTITR